MTCAGVCDQQSFITSAAIAASRTMGYADSEKWKAAVDGDSCVATRLSQVSYERAFAEACLVNVFKHYNGFFPTVLLTDSDKGPTSSDWSCLAKQIEYLDSLPLFDNSFAGDTCAIAKVPEAPQNQPPPSKAQRIKPGGGYAKVVPLNGETPSIAGKSLNAPPTGVVSATQQSKPAASMRTSAKSSTTKAAEASGSLTSESSMKSPASEAPSSTSAAESSPTPSVGLGMLALLPSNASTAEDGMPTTEVGGGLAQTHSKAAQAGGYEPILRNFALDKSQSASIRRFGHVPYIWVGAICAGVAFVVA